MQDYSKKYSDYVLFFENSLKNYFIKLNNSAPKALLEAMDYSISNGGKRLRPILLYSTAEALGVKIEEIEYFALALEMIHSYSLVHDDLPSMDNDDFRRGKPSTHKQFGEAMGILAGDALLNLAVETCLQKDNFSILDAKALKTLFNCSGYSGMIAGQVLDLQSEKTNERTVELLNDIYLNKCAKLIIAPVLIASILSGNKYYDELKEFAINLGIMFQISDDILDVEGTLELIGKTPRKDEKANKFTSISIWGLEGAKKKIDELYAKSKNALNNVPNSDFLQFLLDKCYKRKK